MSSIDIAPATSLASFVIPIPRTSVVTEVWAEFATVAGVPQEHVECIIKQGIRNFLIDTVILSFLDGRDFIKFEVRLLMDWRRHELLLQHTSDLQLSPRTPFTLQLHDGFEQLFTFMGAIKRREKISRVDLTVMFRPEIRSNPQLYARAQAFLGVSERPRPQYAPGIIQPDLPFRFSALPETTFVVREVWPSKSG